MRFGIYAPNFGEFSDPAQFAEARPRGGDRPAGTDFSFGIICCSTGRTPIPLTDAWIVLAAIAASTKRIFLGPMITPVARRRPWKLAREAARA